MTLFSDSVCSRRVLERCGPSFIQQAKTTGYGESKQIKFAWDEN